MIGFIAGYLEGEGCFQIQRARGCPEPRIIITTTDYDVAAHVAWVLNRTKPLGPYKPTGMGKKWAWHIQCRGSRAVGWMMTCYPFLSGRRRGKIRSILSAWKGKATRPCAVARIWSSCKPAKILG